MHPYESSCRDSEHVVVAVAMTTLSQRVCYEHDCTTSYGHKTQTENE